MKKTHGFFIGMSVILLIASSANCVSQDWPQFRGISRDSKVTGFTAPATWPKNLSQVWKVSAGFGDASPILSGNRIYLATRQGNDEVTICLDASTGKEVWKNSYSTASVTGPSSSHPGPRSTPAIADGKIVTFGVTGILSCLDAATGKVIWRKDNPSNEVPQFFTAMSPLIVEGMCIAHLGTQNKGEVVSLDLATGAEKWKWTGDGPAYASPSLMIMDGKKHIIVQTEKNLIAVNLVDGKLLWQIPSQPQQRFYNCPSPYINGRTIYFTGQGNGIKAIQVSMEGGKYVPKEIWNNTEVGAKWNTPVLKDGFLYGFSDQKRIYCLDAATGKTVWIDNAVNSDFATIIDCGSVLMGLPSTGNLLVFKPDTRQYTEITRYKVAETPVYAFPVVAGKMIYIKDAESLSLLRIE